MQNINWDMEKQEIEKYDGNVVYVSRRKYGFGDRGIIFNKTIYTISLNEIHSNNYEIELRASLNDNLEKIEEIEIIKEPSQLEKDVLKALKNNRDKVSTTFLLKKR